MPHAFRRRSLLGFAAILTIAALSAPSVGMSPAAAVDGIPEPVLLYQFEDAAGASVVRNSGAGGSALDGVVRGPDGLSKGAGASGEGASLRFPGAPRDPSSTAPWVEIPDGLFGDQDGITVGTWIKWDGTHADQLPWAYLVGGNNVPAGNWGVYYVPNEGGRSAAVANSGSEVKAFAPALTPDTWTYLTTVATEQTLTFYINGAEVARQPIDFDVSRLSSENSTTSGMLGRVPWSGEWAAHFAGEFDDFAVYREALSADQVSSVYSDYAGEVTSVAPAAFEVTTPSGMPPVLPATTDVTYASGSAAVLPIAWQRIPARAYAEPGAKFTVKGTVLGWDGELTATVQVTERETETFAFDLARDTGAFRGGASGTLYGLGDEQSPTQALVNGAAMTNISQKPPFGTQHPGGDVFHVQDAFFDKWGEDLYVYTQDYYPDWPYNGGRRPGDDLTFVRGDDGRLTGEKVPGGNGIWDYLEVLETVVDEIATRAEDPASFVFIPINEPDWIWYSNNDGSYLRYMIEGGQPDSFTPGGVNDWVASVQVIRDVYARHGLAEPRVGGPGDTIYFGKDHQQRFLETAKAHDAVPDVFIWHELYGYAWMPDRMTGYRAAALGAGIAESEIPPVTITEWGRATDMASPADILTWFASFEAAKVDAQTAYWTASGTLSDNQALVNSANGAWWLFKWYGDMNGSRTAQVISGERRAIAAVDRDDRRAQIVYGGVARGKDALLEIDGIDAGVFGDDVDIEVRESRVSGTDGQAGSPRVVAAFDSEQVQDGRVTIRVPSSDATSAFQVIITPATARNVEAEADAQQITYDIEAENTSLTNARVRQSPDDGYRASAGRDVWGFTEIDSRADWAVDVEEGGLYRLQTIGATPGVPVEHALFVDDEFSQKIRYGANAMKPAQVQSVARGSAEVFVRLEKGEHTLSLRTSADGKTLLPNADFARGRASGVTLDRFSLTRVGDVSNTDRDSYPATTFRLADGAVLTDDGTAAIGAGQRADLYPAVLESGYYDIEVAWEAPVGATLDLAVNGRTASRFSAVEGGETSRVRVHLPLGVSEVELRGSAGVRVDGLTTTRAVEGDSAIIRVQAEDDGLVTLGGTASVEALGSGPETGIATNADGSFVGGLGITDREPANEGSMTIARADGFAAAGEYNAIVHYSNDAIEGTHEYNPQVVDLGLQATEAGTEGLVGRSTFRYSYAQSNFFEAVMPLSLKTDDGAVRFGNTRETLYIDEKGNADARDDVAVAGYAMAPDVDWIAFAPFVLETDGDQPEVPAAPPAPTVTVSGSDAVVSWDAPGDGGSPILSYTVTVASVGGGRPERTEILERDLGTRNSITISSLPQGSFEARVVAHNSVGSSPMSAASAAFHVAAVPAELPLIRIAGELVPGGWLSVSGSHFPVDREGELELRSTPIPLGMVQTDGTGAFTTRVQLPDTVSAGLHTIIARVDGVEATLQISVAARPAALPQPEPNMGASAADPLAATGAAVPIGMLVLGGAILLIVGTAMLRTRRREGL